MNDFAMTMPMPRVNVGQLLKVVGLPTERERAATVAAAHADFLGNIVTVADGLISTAIEQRTSASFVSVRKEVFPQYVAVVIALGSIARVVLSTQTIDRISLESFSEMEADFRDLADSTVGSDLGERGLFTLWTIRKIYDLAKEIEAAEVPAENSQEASEEARVFVRYALWTRFHLDCLIKSMRTGKAIHPEVTEHLRDGLRAAVDAYAHIRQWADIRIPHQDIDPGHIEWTPEDQQWVDDSLADLERSV